MPTLHFKTKSINGPEPDTTQSFDISPFVVPGQLLMTLSEQVDDKKEKESGSSNKNDNDSGFEITFGEGVEADEEENNVFSTRYGYPELKITSSGKKTSYYISVIPLINISADKMEAYITAYPPLEDEGVVQKTKVIEALEHLRVNFGVDEDAINRVLHQVEETGFPVSDTIIARGRAPIDGKDSSVRLEIEIGPIAGKELANGTIDFRERRMFVAVEKDQLIATKIPRTRGMRGVNLFGDEIKQIEGKDTPIQVSEEAKYLEEEKTIVATADGIVTVVNENSFRVSTKQKIDGDIDFSIGNLRAQSAVEISGSVLPDFRVLCKGDLSVGENVNMALVNSQSNLVIKGGIVGREARVRVQGDADVGYIERGELSARGNGVIRFNAYYAKILIGGNLFCPDNVKLIGGTTIVGGSIVVGQIGSETADPMTVGAGINPRRYQRYHELKKEYFELVHELQRVSRRYGGINSKDRKVIRIREYVEELEQELTSLNLVSEASETSLGSVNSFFSTADIKVSGLVPEGTRVMIGNDIVELEKSYHGVRLFMSPTTGMIEVEPL